MRVMHALPQASLRFRRRWLVLGETCGAVCHAFAVDCVTLTLYCPPLPRARNHLHPCHGLCTAAGTGTGTGLQA